MMNAAEATPNGMNDEDDNNIINYSCRDNHTGDDNIDQRKHSQSWSTWEELLLACAVKRHGFHDWDSVAMEVQSRSSLPRFLTTAQNCKHKYRDLKRRFEDDGVGDNETEDGDDKADNIPWLNQLRGLRVAELRRDLQRYDVSILSLESKVKKLEEERDRSVGCQKPDLDDDSKGERSENDVTEPARPNTVMAEEKESDRENGSINESNSTASGGKLAGDGDETSRAREDSGNPDPDQVCKAAAEDGSEVSHSGESGTSAGFGRTWKRSGKEGQGGGGEMRTVAGESEPLILFLEMIRAHPRGSLFERRLRIQGTEEYKRLVREHLDMETIQEKLEKGYYASSIISFYRDLHLLFTNAIIFFPNSSPESIAAHQLRTLVSTKINQEFGKLTAKQDPETSDSSLTRQKPSDPLVPCKKRRLLSAKPSSPSSSFILKEEKTSDQASADDKIVASVRSSRRRTNKGVPALATSTKTNKKQMGSKTNSPTDKKQETAKADKKKSVADFLKRIKNSPANSPKKGGNRSKGQKKSSDNGKKDKDTKTRQRELRSNNAGKKKVEEDNTPLKRSRGRQQKKAAEVAESSGKQPKKRKRR